VQGATIEEGHGLLSSLSSTLVTPETKLAVNKKLSGIGSMSSDDADIAAHGGGESATGGVGAGNSDGDWVKDPTENDVLCGRGGSINSHPGNERFRTLVEKRKRVYLTARFKREKRLIASSIVSEIRSLKPPGRFLSRDPKSGQWKDIGDEKARDKTSQALRENAPSLRAEIETELKEHHHRAGSRWDDDDDDEDEDGCVKRADSSTSHTSSSARQQQQHGLAGHPPHPPPPHYFSSWGYPYYGYPPPPHGHYPPPPPHSYDPSSSPWPHPYPTYGYPSVPPPPGGAAATQPPKSALEQTADTIKSYFSFGGGGNGSASGSNGKKSSSGSKGHDGNTRSGSVSKKSQPLHYFHNDKKRRMVKFRDDATGGGGSYSRRGGGSTGSLNRHHHAAFPGPGGGSTVGTNSLMDDDFMADQDVGMMGASHSVSGCDDDMEPEHIESIEDQASNSLMAQVANHILSSIGSWDAASAICGHEDQAYDAAAAAAIGTTPLQRHSKSSRRSDSSSRRHHHHQDHHDSQEDNMEALADEDMGVVEWEGQEVLLMETSKRESSPQRMPPPPRPRPFPSSSVSERLNNEQASLGGFSSLGSCHSWLPEQISGAASFFSYNSSSRNPQPSSQASHNGGISPAGSMDLAMEYSSSIGGGHHGNEHCSMGSIGGGSIGNHSLSRVFENEALDQPLLSPVSQTTGFMSHRSLQQVPSWERSVRSRSPLSLGSMADDESLISKTSSKLSDSGNHNTGTPLSNHPDAMAWERRE
jgi:hypothetical protein